jgi:hypothetical protein
MRKLNRKYDININDNIDISCGTTNKNNPKVIFLSCKTRINPNYEIEYHKVLDDIFNKLRYEMKHSLLSSNLFESKFILDYDIAANLFVNQQKILTFDIFLRQKSNCKLLKDIIQDIENQFKPIFYNFTKNFNENNFSITKTKH